MTRKRVDLESVCCPFINLEDPRCAKHFKLSRLDEALSLCLSNHHACSIYHALVNRRPVVLSLGARPQPGGASGAVRAAG